jgi:hypothetical protein
VTEFGFWGIGGKTGQQGCKTGETLKHEALKTMVLEERKSNAAGSIGNTHPGARLAPFQT